jgi:hypothetical protein
MQPMQGTPDAQGREDLVLSIDAFLSQRAGKQGSDQCKTLKRTKTLKIFLAKFSFKT